MVGDMGMLLGCWPGTLTLDSLHRMATLAFGGRWGCTGVDGSYYFGDGGGRGFRVSRELL